MIRKKLIASLALGLAAFAGRAAMADTIDVNDLSQSPGVFNYTIQFDTNASVVANSDGFVIYDFGDETGFNFTGGFSNSDWKLVVTTTSNALVTPLSVDAVATAVGATETPPITLNEMGFNSDLTFIYVGSPNPGVGVVTGTLTIDSGITSGTATGIYAEIDDSGKAKAANIQASTVSIPSLTVGGFAPAPSSLLAGAALMGLVAIKAKKAVKGLM